MLSSKEVLQSFGSSDLCFDKNEFLKGDFSVDSFLYKHRNVSSLENMRDDLGLFMKILRSAMIELINKDYGDFVNLSANLVGLDNFIQSIRKKLRYLETEVLCIKSILDSNSAEIKDYLETKKLLRDYKTSLWSLSSSNKSMQKLVELQSQLEVDLNPTFLEQATLEYIKLGFNLESCRKYINSPQRLQEQEIRRYLLEKLKSYFINALNVENNDVEWCLKIYSALDGYKTVESIVREEIVGNYMNKIISERALQNSPQGLAGIYNQILEFVPLYMKSLLLVTSHEENKKNFNFLINSFWKEVEDRIETQMPSIFAPGNPDLFFKNYATTQDFLSKIESILGSKALIDSFRNSDQFRNFERRWNLPVYFQIRFQEIAGYMENACNQPVEDVYLNACSNVKKPTKIAYNCIVKCWDSGIYINKLFPKFLKLSLQIVSRLNRWVSESLQTVANKNTQFDKIKVLALLHYDLNIFRSQLPNISEIIRNNLPNELVPHSTVLKKCVADSERGLDLNLIEIEKLTADQIIAEMSSHVRCVSDIPRLFRKTNRETPNKPCSYVEQMVESVKKFYDNYASNFGEEKAKEIILLVFCSITTKYYAAITGVLTSVQKTEESLRRLKNLRDKSTINPPTTSYRGTLSDDDKIRVQLQIDTIFWVNTVKEFNIKESDVNNLTDLINLFEDFTRIKATNS